MQALAAARQLASVRACRFALTMDLKTGQLPFVGESGVRKIRDMVETAVDGEGATCYELEAFR